MTGRPATPCHAPPGLKPAPRLTAPARPLPQGRPLEPVLRNSLIELGVLALFVSLAVVRRRWWHALAFIVLLAGGPAGWLARAVG